MMTAYAEKMLTECISHFDSIQKFLFMSRAIEFQKEAINDLEQLSSEIKKLKKRAIQEYEEDSANALLSMKCMVDVYLSEMRMWVDLKLDNTGQSWKDLITAQMAVHWAIISHEIGSLVENRSDWLLMLENVLFPPVPFASAGFITKRTKCSICGAEYASCKHIKGRPYMGELCSEIIEEADLREVSVVPDPANKMNRIIAFEDNGKKRDLFSWRLLE